MEGATEIKPDTERPLKLKQRVLSHQRLSLLKKSVE